jgi:hypothetical protein
MDLQGLRLPHDRQLNITVRTARAARMGHEPYGTKAVRSNRLWMT